MRPNRPVIDCISNNSMKHIARVIQLDRLPLFQLVHRTARLLSSDDHVCHSPTTTEYFPLKINQFIRGNHNQILKFIVIVEIIIIFVLNELRAINAKCLATEMLIASITEQRRRGATRVIIITLCHYQQDRKLRSE